MATMSPMQACKLRFYFGRFCSSKRYLGSPNSCINILYKVNDEKFTVNWSSSHCHRYIRTAIPFLQTEVETVRDLPLTPAVAVNGVLYRFRWIKLVRFVSRVKIVHVAVVTSLTWPMIYWYSSGFVSFPVLISSVVGALGATAGLVALSFFFRRIVGEISVNNAAETVTISTLTFWGNRRDRTFPRSALIPLDDTGIDVKNMFHRLEVHGTSHVFLLSLRHGKFFNESFFKVVGLGAR